MKINLIKNINKNKFCKLSHSGISLIVLVITIIVIIILAAAVILILNNNNPITEANRARYESDVANMQAIFTNTVAKVMAQNQGTIEVNVGELNSIQTVENGVSSAEGRVKYTVNNPLDSSNENGTIIFNTGTNNATTYYTGRKLPLYSSGKTVCYVDSQGVISLKIDEVTYGKGEQEGEVKKEIQITESENPMLQAWNYDAITDFHNEEYRSKITKVKFNITDKVPVNRIDEWDVSEAKDGSVMAWVEDDGAEGYILTIAGKEKIIANSNSNHLFRNMVELTEIENLELIENLPQINFYGCAKMLSIDLSKIDMTKVNGISFEECSLLKNINFGTLVGCKVNYLTFNGCCSLTNLDLSPIDTSSVTSMGSMFKSCKNLKTLILGNNFDMSKVIYTSGMFDNCQNLITTINFNSDNLNYMDNMFYNAAIIPPAQIIVNYTEKTGRYLDNNVFPNIKNSNVVKGVQL